MFVLSGVGLLVYGKSPGCCANTLKSLNFLDWSSGAVYGLTIRGVTILV